MSDDGSFNVDPHDLAGCTPGRSALRPGDLRRERQRRRAKKVARTRSLLTGEPIYVSPTCDRPAPPEAVAAWAAYHAEGPGAPGDAAYIAEGGPGHRERFREARAVFLERGRTRSALEAAADHGDWLPREMILALLASGDLAPREALDLQGPGLIYVSDVKTFAELVGACSAPCCHRSHYRAGLCQAHYKERS